MNTSIVTRNAALLFAAFSLTCGVYELKAENPFVQTWFTSDPAPMVDGDRLYVYTGHDEDGADFFWMQEWRVYSTTDMVNWTDHGSPLALESFSWADDRAWASQTIKRNGKYYWYICAHSKISGGMAIGVAVSKTPYGPFVDAIGKPLYETGSWDFIDPTVFIDNDGQAYLYWGNPRLYYCKLNEDMISYSGEVEQLDINTSDQDRYTEGPWIDHFGDKYYMIYAAGGVPEHIAYSESDTPLGPWTYKGTIMPEGGTLSFTNHSGVIEFKGHSYFFYHTGKLPGGGGFGRSVAVEEFKRNADGSFPIINPTDAGVKAIGTLNPYQRVEAETMSFSKGLHAQQMAKKGVYISDTHNGDYIKVSNVDFGDKGAEKFTVSAASALRGGTIQIFLDKMPGARDRSTKPVATVEISSTGGWEKFQKFSTAIEQPVTGVHDIYFLFQGRKGPELFSLDYWIFK